MYLQSSLPPDLGMVLMAVYHMKLFLESMRSAAVTVTPPLPQQIRLKFIFNPYLAISNFGSNLTKVVNSIIIKKKSTINFRIVYTVYMFIPGDALGLFFVHPSVSVPSRGVWLFGARRLVMEAQPYVSPFTLFFLDSARCLVFRVRSLNARFYHDSNKRAGPGSMDV